MAGSPPYVPSRRAVKAVQAWANASKDMLKAIEAEGIIVNRSDDPAADMLPRSQVLARCAVEMTRCMLVYVALITGRDVVEADQELRRAEEEAIRSPHVDLLKQVLADSMPDRGYFVIRPGTVDAVRAALAAAGDLGDLVTFRVVCPACGWRHSWQQYEREPGQFDGLCRECDTRCNGDTPAVVRGGPDDAP